MPDWLCVPATGMLATTQMVMAEVVMAGRFVSNRVLVTGLGAISPLGVDKERTFAAALAGRSAVCRAPAEIAQWLPHALVAPAADPEPLLDRQYAGLDRATQFALVAVEAAVTHAGVVPAPADAGRFGVFSGIGFGGATLLEGLYSRFYKTVLGPQETHRNPAVLHPLTVPRMMPNAAAALVSMRYGLRGPSNTYSVACASSAVAIGEAFRAIRNGYLEAALVLGAEAMLTIGSLLAWNALRVMASPAASADGDVAQSCRPFALGRCGFVLGEGAAALVLETEQRALARGAPIIAELCGYGCSSDANHLTAPSAAEQARAMQQALAEARLPQQQVGYLNAHGTATDTGDVVETQSIRAAFGVHADHLAVSSTKAVHGHLIGASGILEFIISLMAMNSGSLPPTAHLDAPDPRCDLDFIPQRARQGRPLDAVMSNSFAFGGSNVSLLARRYAPS